MSEDPFERRHWVDRFVLVFVRESTLWPVALVVIGHAIAFLGPLMLWSVRDGLRLATVTLVLLVLLSLAAMAWELRRAGPGALTGLLASTWALSLAAAVVADRYGLF
ncbi:MAG: hypothetical protein QNK04_23190 [Myxococcota bacterium]|nr:hypothetical protein [Myxococcota bacterium]